MKHVMKAALVAIAVAFATSASAQTFVRMVSGPAGGSWYPFGAKIAEVLQKNISGISTQNRPGHWAASPHAGRMARSKRRISHEARP